MGRSGLCGRTYWLGDGDELINPYRLDNARISCLLSSVGVSAYGLQHYLITLKLGRAKVNAFRRFGIGVGFAERI